MTPRKTAIEIKTAILTQLQASLNKTFPLFPLAFTRVLAKVLGGIFVMLYEYAGHIMLQTFVQTASNRPMEVGGITVTPLALWGSLVGLDQDLGQPAELVVRMSVTTLGGVLPSGTTIIDQRTGITFLTVGDVALTSATVNVPIRSTVVGMASNAEYGDTLFFVSAPAAYDRAVTVLSQTVLGTEAESTEQYRRKVLNRYAAAPQGGAYADYRDWAVAVSGVKNAYPYSGWTDAAIPASTSGQVFVYIESAGDPDGIPTPLTNGRPPGGALLTDVFDHIEADDAGLASRRPVNTYIRIFPISRKDVHITVNGLQVEDTAEAIADIEAGLSEYLLDREPYIPGLSRAPRKDILSAAALGGIAGQIAASHGGVVLGVTMTIDGAGVNAYYLQEGVKAKAASIAWT